MMGVFTPLFAILGLIAVILLNLLLYRPKFLRSNNPRDALDEMYETAKRRKTIEWRIQIAEEAAAARARGESYTPPEGYDDPL